jgi:drug/metabolite transporter (DMT)-like permease
MLKSLSPRARALAQAMLVTLIWSLSWVLIRTGLEEIPALTFAGLRYMLAFVCLLPLALRSEQRTALRQLKAPDWRRLALFGLLLYSATQGAQFLALDRLPAVTTSLLLSFTAVIVALLGMALLAEIPTRQQWGGIGLYLVGVLIYFYPIAIPGGEVIGLIIALAGAVANSLSTVWGRDINRRATIPPLLVTVISMGFGAVIMLAAGIVFQGLPALSLKSWVIIVWLAVVHTAFTFTLWNLTQRTLSALETSLINNTMLIQIALLAWLFLGENLTAREVLGMILAGIGTLLVQLRRAEPPAKIRAV